MFINKQDDLNKIISKREAEIKIDAEDRHVNVDRALSNDKKLIKLIMKDRKMEREIRNDYPAITSYNDLHAFGAFVVFDDVLACNRCFMDYKLSNRLIYQNRLKFMDNYSIKVKYADDPVNINWNNLEVSK